jgi:hypothetical protein
MVGIAAIAFSGTVTEIAVILTGVVAYAVLKIGNRNSSLIRKIVLVTTLFAVGAVMIESFAIMLNGSGIWSDTFEKFQELLHGGPSVVNRQIEIKEMWFALPDALATGRGFGNYLPALLGSRGYSEEPVWGHNEYLYVLLMMGFPGFFALLSLIIWVLSHAHRILKITEEGSIQLVWARSTFLLYIGLAVGALTVPRFVRGSGWIGPQILAGVIFALRYMKKQESRMSSKGRHRNGLSLKVYGIKDNKHIPVL